MNTLALIILIFFSGATLAYLSSLISNKLPGWVALLTTMTGTVLFYMSFQNEQALSFSIIGLNLEWALDNYTILFAHIIFGLGILASLYSVQYMQNKSQQGSFYANFLLSIGSMFGIIISKDFISFFIFWEIMTWSSFLIVVWNGIGFRKNGIWYMAMSAIGAYAMLTAIVLINSEIGTYSLQAFFNAVQENAIDNLMLVSILLLIGFAVKAALMPLHIWAPRAYSNTPASYTSVFSGALSKMGVFGMGLVLIRVFRFSGLQDNFDYALVSQFTSHVLAWLGGITAAIATLYALVQKDAKKLLAYSSIAQLGYIVIGLAIGTKLAVMSALFLAIMHAVFKGALFMAVGAVERQVGTTDMTKISGLIRRMPWTFFVTLVSIIALAGVPPLSGFVGKWMLYEALITNGNFFLVVVVFFSSTAAFLYSYRILFGLFLGQEEDDTAHVKEAPATMVIPMVILALFLIVTGTYPGIVFEPIAHGMEYLGFTDVTWNMTVLSNVWGDSVNLQYVSTTIGVAFMLALIFLTFKGRKGTRGVSTKDISTSGEIPLEHENLTFQLDFFKPFERAAAPLYKRSITKIYEDVANGLEALFDFTRKIYTGNGQTYAIYVVAFLVTLLIVVQNML
ncbi:MAG: hypothetical protein JXR60_03460 [Bacteroidales bacterium]|nr:hypothetical protein [Bacteroidales bacterium]